MLILIRNMELGREFNAWKQAQRDKVLKDRREGATTKKYWKEPSINWQEFELQLRYGRRWRRITKARKEAYRKRIAELDRGYNEPVTNGVARAGRNEFHDTNHVEECAPKMVRSSLSYFTAEDGRAYDELIKYNARRWYTQDNLWHYKLLGECYIHGMMDGEALAYQNDNAIPATVFEIR